MKKSLLLLMFCTYLILNADAQTRLMRDSGTYILHKLENPVGRENWKAEKKLGKTIYNISCEMRDKSISPLKGEFSATATLDPLLFKLKGNTSPYNTIGDSVVVSGDIAKVKTIDSTFTKKLTGFNFPTGGYLPATMQQLLIQYWIKHNQPAIIHMLPYGDVKIKADGTDIFHIHQRKIILKRYLVNGLVWGNEFLWTDSSDQMIGLLTTNDSSDKFEVMQASYEELLPAMISKSAFYGLKALSGQATRDHFTPTVIAVKGGNLIDVNSGKVTMNSVILLQNGKITGIGRLGELPIPAKASIIDARGKFLLPGFWDMHAHYAQAEWGPAFLAAGITTVRDCTNEFDYVNPLKKAIDAGEGIGPRILKAGLIDGKGPEGTGVVQVATKAEAIAAVDRFKANGYVQIKLFSTLTPPLVKAACDEAHRLGLTVTGHIPNGMNLIQAVDSGMDMVNHIHFAYAIMKHLKGGAVNFDDSVSRAAVKFMSAHHVVIDATVNSLERVFRPLNKPILTIEPAFSTLPLPVKQRLQNEGMDTALARKYIPMYTSIVKMIKVLHDAGVPVVAGSDQGFPGYSLDRELEIYVSAGLSPLEAIRCATIIPATVMKQQNQFGSIAVGKQADLVIIDGNPLTRISNLRKVSRVIKGGKIYNSAGLRQLAGFNPVPKKPS